MSKLRKKHTEKVNKEREKYLEVEQPAQQKKIKYRWEFIRRDPEYKRSYKKYLKLQEALESGEDCSTEIQELCSKFDLTTIYGFIDPSLPFEELVEREYEGLYKHFVEYNQMDKHLKDGAIYAIRIRLGMKGLPIMTWQRFDPEKPFESGNRLYLEIDFTKVTSIDKLQQEIRSEIHDKWIQFLLTKEKYLKENLDWVGKKDKDYETILAVGDHKKKNPDMTFQEIAQQVYPHDTDPDSQRKKAEQRYKVYKELVNGGWRYLQLF